MKCLMTMKHGLSLFLSLLLLVGSLSVEAANSETVEKRLLKSCTCETTRTTLDKKAASVNVKDFGAKLDGVTDISAAIVLALNSMTSGTLLIPGDAKISAPIRMRSNVDVLVTGTLNATGLSSAFNWTGVSVLTTALTVQANVADNTVTVADSTGISAGDYVVLENNVFHTFLGAWQGIDSHFSEVIAVTGNTLTLNNSVPEVFPVASSLIRKITPVQNANVNVKKIIGAPTDAFYMKWAIHNKCTGEVNPIGTKAVRFFAAFWNRATEICGINPVANTVSPNGYGGLFDFGASDNIIENSCFENIREIAHGFNARRNVVRKNTIVRPFDSGVNTHGLGSVDAVIEDNTITDAQQYGIAIGQKPPFGWWPDVGTKILNNKIINSKATGIREAQFDAPIAAGTVIDGNDIRNVGTGNIPGNNHGIAIIGSATGTSIVNPIIRRNRIKGSGTVGGIGIYVVGISAKRTVIDDNVIDTTGGSGIRWNSAGGDHSADGNVLRNIGERGFQSNGDERIILGKRNRVESSTLGAYLNVTP